MGRKGWLPERPKGRGISSQADDLIYSAQQRATKILPYSDMGFGDSNVLELPTNAGVSLTCPFRQRKIRP
jgi:hypothetical protein